METIFSLQFLHDMVAFKSYYVVWKRDSYERYLAAQKGLNRTM